MTKPEVWIDRFFVAEKFAPTYAGSDKFLLPARHLAWYESPLGAAESVVRKQLLLAVPKTGLRLIDARSHVRGDVNDAENPLHWDLCFVFEGKAPAKFSLGRAQPPWFKELGFRALSGLAPDDFTRGHGDVLEMAGLIRNRLARRS
ncbi:MAG: hypothetical protein LYZ70_03665 [Nitrososphaerales archaeon]|nr:hypothetical protein [Nitrososphaerales archaeon]